MTECAESKFKRKKNHKWISEVFFSIYIIFFKDIQQQQQQKKLIIFLFEKWAKISYTQRDRERKKEEEEKKEIYID